MGGMLTLQDRVDRKKRELAEEASRKSRANQANGLVSVTFYIKE